MQNASVRATNSRFPRNREFVAETPQLRRQSAYKIARTTPKSKKSRLFSRLSRNRHILQTADPVAADRTARRFDARRRSEPVVTDPAPLSAQALRGQSGYGATIASGLPRWRFTISLLSAPRYAFADATKVSGSAPLAVTDLPFSDRRTDTSAWASVPSVTACT